LGCCNNSLADVYTIKSQSKRVCARNIRQGGIALTSEFRTANLDQKKVEMLKTLETLMNQIDDNDPEVVLVAYEKSNDPTQSQ
jgi:hypothetical protein